MAILYEAALVAAWLLAVCGRGVVTPPEGGAVSALLLLGIGWWLWREVAARREADRGRRLSLGQWWGFDATVRHAATPLVIGGCLAVVVWASMRASVGVRLGGYGALLVLFTLTVMAAKLVAETYLFAQIGGDESPRQASAQTLTGRLSGWAKLRYVLGVFGGVILPLGAQMLAGGAKNIPAVTDASAPALVATIALVCLIPGELLERWLFWRV